MQNGQKICHLLSNKYDQCCFVHSESLRKKRPKKFENVDYQQTLKVILTHKAFNEFWIDLFLSSSGIEL